MTVCTVGRSKVEIWPSQNIWTLNNDEFLNRSFQDNLNYWSKSEDKVQRSEKSQNDFFQVDISSKNRTNEFYFTNETSGWLLFVHFLEEIEDTKKTFRNYLTFTGQEISTAIFLGFNVSNVGRIFDFFLFILQIMWLLSFWMLIHAYFVVI